MGHAILEDVQYIVYRQNFGRYDGQDEPVQVVGSDITGCVLIEFPDGYRTWISGAGLREAPASARPTDEGTTPIRPSEASNEKQPNPTPNRDEL